LAGWLVHLCCENSLMMALGAETRRCLFMSRVCCVTKFIYWICMGCPVSSQWN